MPKRVDHGGRRDQVARALWRIAADEGLRAVTLRRVAAEAGISMNLVQYYFPTKVELVHHGLGRLLELAAERRRAELTRVRTTGDLRLVLRTCLVGLLPVTEEGRVLSAVHDAYLSHALGDPGVRELLNRVPHHVADELVPVLRAAREAGAVPASVDPELEVTGLVAMASGLASGVLVGSYRVEEVVAVLDHRLAVLFGG
ncbi:TetR/AcrR family transcriptional regulator [Saccharothrix syringae]|uniref:TetR/AcrR family transcriptional regulator n=1 Tax=Saccharothrix syringae TaxID=103733 RepID=A0A5Q0H6P5_SACSY|nr:TetR/AcrR family transcriptional regulator [Saccharothrix syringae]QFZ21520.1 TetR/AcrR family transcriptional regulator [Saccharothrix syringae]